MRYVTTTRGINPTATIRRLDGAFSFSSHRDGVMVDGEFIPRINGTTYPTVAYATDEWGVPASASISIRGINPTAIIKRPDGAITVFVP